MTAAQLARLAELAAYAAGFYAEINPSASRLFEDTALRADTLWADLRRDEELARLGAQQVVRSPECANGVTL
jgi:hypothetical protein